MRICAVIAEYNPFHNGHAYQLAAIREQLQPDAVLVLMSGTFVQRGTPAVIDPFTRAQAAVACGADLVLELPSFAACASAADFAGLAVSVLDRLGIVTDLVFGVEHASLDSLQRISECLVEETPVFSAIIKEEVANGSSFPLARMRAVEKTLGHGAAALLTEPNHILAIEYLKALRMLDSRIRPYAIARSDSGYHSLDGAGGLYSATALRHRWAQAKDIDAVKVGIPTEAVGLLEQRYRHVKTAPLDMPVLHALLYDRLIHGNPQTWSGIVGFSKDFANRLAAAADYWTDYHTLIDQLKNKSLTHSRIRRHLLHLLLGMQKEELQCFRHCILSGSFALSVLAMTKTNGAAMIKAVRSHSGICLLTNPGKQKGSLPSDYLPVYERQLQINRLYYYFLHQHYGLPLINELRHGTVILPR